MGDYKPVRLTKAQRKNLFDCHVGVGVLAYKSAADTITETEFYVDPKNRICYIGNGRPVEIELQYDETDWPVEAVANGQSFVPRYKDGNWIGFEFTDDNGNTWRVVAEPSPGDFRCTGMPFDPKNPRIDQHLLETHLRHYYVAQLEAMILGRKR